MRACARSIALLGLVTGGGCRSDDEVAIPTPDVAPEPEPAVAPDVAPTPDLAADRACGEAGPTPTPLPPVLARGMEPIGRGVLRAGEARTVGTVQVRYDPSAWIGTMEVGHHAPAVYVEIDRDEASGGAWGGHHELHADRRFPLHVGPYRVDMRTAAGEPPASLEFEVARDACPAATTIAPSPQPVWMWLSTEAIQQHTYDLQGPLLQVRITAQGAVPRLDVSQLGYQHYFTPRPGEPRTLRVDANLVTIEEVAPGPGTRFEQTWIADGDARVHARVRIEPAPPVPLAEAVAPTSPCGDASPQRTHVPDGLRTKLTVGGQVTLRTGERKRLGALELERVTMVMPRHGRRGGETYHSLRLHGPTPRPDVSFGTFLQRRVVRLERELLRIDPTDGEQLKVGRVAMSCPEGQVLPVPSAPTYVWLSTHGHVRASFGDPNAPALSLQLYLDTDRPGLGVTAEQTYLSRTLQPGDVGSVFTMAGHVVQIVDITAGEGTRREDSRWLGDGPVPAVHVQVLVSPAP